MGRTATCEVKVGSRLFKAPVELETDEIIVRGKEGFRLKFAEIHESAEIEGGVLRVGDRKRTAELQLGAKEAGLWLEKIKNPPSRVDKLGIKAKTRVALIGELPEDLVEEVARVKATVVRGGLVACVLFAVQRPRDLGQLDVLKEWIAPAGAVWVIREKGSETIREQDVRAAAKEHKLVAVKVARISDRYTADKLVIPRKDR
jgi:hypothetical protein